MFVCKQCGRQSQPGEKSFLRVLEVRAHIYPVRTYRVRGDSRERHDFGGAGTQIVRELRMCRECALQPGPAVGGHQ